MPRPRFQRAAPELREAILEAAAGELAANGYDGASINRILLAAGMSKGAFYYYFDDKADLAATVWEREVGHWLESFANLPVPRSADEFWSEMDGLTERGLAQLRESPRRTEILGRMVVAVPKHPELLERFGPVMDEARQRITDFIRQGQVVGAVRNDVSVETLLAVIQSVKQTLAQALLPTDRAPTTKEFDRVLMLQRDMVWRLMEPGKSPAPAPSPLK